MPAFTITKITREHIALAPSPKGLTYGQLLDKLITDAIESGTEIQTIAFDVSPEDWHAIRTGELAPRMAIETQFGV